MSELHKKNLARTEYNNFYFWRSYNGEEIDLLIERDGRIIGYECKWKSEKKFLARSENAPVSSISVITTTNFAEFL
jgi:predicted AAA+ superfamily ATPase